MRTTAGGYEIDDDPGRVDAEAAAAFLTTQAYWARWRGAGDIKQQIAAAWRLVGAYDRAGAMVGFARAAPVPNAAAGTLAGQVVRLEPLQHQHVPGLVAAAASGAELYRWSAVPQDQAQVREYVEAAIAARDHGTAVPFAVVRAADDTVIGSTRFFDFGWWPWPDGHDRTGPDTCEIGYTWLSPAAIRTGANTEMKRLMLTHAFEVWRVQSVCLHTDARNQRSRDAMQRIGARYEGILHAHRLGTDGKPRDSARFSVTAAEWPAVRRRFDELDRRYQRS
jgi:N-acetyltransferase